MDSTAIHTFDGIIDTCKKNKINLIFSHVNEQPMAVMEKSGFIKEVGEANFCKNIDDAVALAEKFDRELKDNRKKAAE